MKLPVQAEPVIRDESYSGYRAAAVAPAEVRGECFRSKDCYGKIGKKSKHNCINAAAKSWQAPGGPCENL